MDFAAQFLAAFKANDCVNACRLMFYHMGPHDDQVSENYMVLIFDDGSKCCYNGTEAWEIIKA